MRKIEKLTLDKSLIDQSDILKKKQMRNLWGGIKGCCVWCCVVDAGANCHKDLSGTENSYDACWAHEDDCPLPEYGFKITDC